MNLRDGAWASSAALLVAGLAVFRHSKVMAAEEKPSWLQGVLNGAQLANSIWPCCAGGPDESENVEAVLHKLPSGKSYGEPGSCWATFNSSFGIDMNVSSWTSSDTSRRHDSLPSPSSL